MLTLRHGLNNWALDEVKCLAQGFMKDLLHSHVISLFLGAQSINQSVNQSINQSIIAISQSINQTNKLIVFVLGVASFPESANHTNTPGHHPLWSAAVPAQDDRVSGRWRAAIYTSRGFTSVGRLHSKSNLGM